MTDNSKIKTDSRGGDREGSLARDRYLNEGYFELRQLNAFAHQISDIYNLEPKSIIEIGIGNGFTSSFLKSAGYNITTCDINENLAPDHVLPVQQLQKVFLPGEFDLAVCCEVLEHIPFEEFEPAIAAIASVADRLYLTLPNYRKFFGFSGYFDVPRLRTLFNIGIYLPIPRKITPEHFWELDSASHSKTANIISIIEKYFPKVNTHNYKLNRYHRAFICEK